MSLLTSGARGSSAGWRWCSTAGDLIHGNVLDNGCGVGMYVQRLSENGGRVFGLEYEFERLQKARSVSPLLTCAAGENLPYPSNSFDLVLSHEVLEHVADDRRAVEEIIRVLRTGGSWRSSCPTAATPSKHTVFSGAENINLATNPWSITCPHSQK